MPLDESDVRDKWPRVDDISRPPTPATDPSARPADEQPLDVGLTPAPSEPEAAPAAADSLDASVFAELDEFFAATTAAGGVDGPMVGALDELLSTWSAVDENALDTDSMQDIFSLPEEPLTERAAGDYRPSAQAAIPLPVVSPRSVLPSPPALVPSPVASPLLEPPPDPSRG